MADKKTQATAPIIDEEYKEAIKSVADNNMRTDVLGPHFCRVIENHTPASDTILSLLKKKISTDPDIKDAIKKIIKEYNDETKVKWVERGIGVGGTIALAVIIWFIQQFIRVPKP